MAQQEDVLPDSMFKSRFVGYDPGRGGIGKLKKLNFVKKKEKEAKDEEKIKGKGKKI